MIELLIALLFVGAGLMALALYLRSQNKRMERTWPIARKPKRIYEEVEIFGEETIENEPLPDLDEHEKFYHDK